MNNGRPRLLTWFKYWASLRLVEGSQRYQWLRDVTAAGYGFDDQFTSVGRDVCGPWLMLLLLFAAVAAAAKLLLLGAAGGRTQECRWSIAAVTIAAGLESCWD